MEDDIQTTNKTGDEIGSEPVANRYCDCQWVWEHRYFQCQRKFMPKYQTTERQAIDAVEREQRLTSVFRDQIEVVCKLKQGLYWDLWEAIHKSRKIFLMFVYEEPYRLEQYWEMRPHYDPNFDSAYLAAKLLPACNLGHAIIQRLLRPDVHQTVFGEDITDEESQMMMRSKLKYAALHNLLLREIQFGDNPHQEGGFNDVSMPDRSRRCYTTISESVNGGSSFEGEGDDQDFTKVKEIGFEIHQKVRDDIAEVVANRAPTEQEGSPADRDQCDDGVPLVNGHRQDHEKEAELDYQAQNGIARAVANVTVTQQGILVIRWQRDEGETHVETGDEQYKNGTAIQNGGNEEEQTINASIMRATSEENAPVVNGHRQEDDQQGQDDIAGAVTHLAPTEERIAALNEDDEVQAEDEPDRSHTATNKSSMNEGIPDELSDSGCEIAEMYPEAVAALLAIVNLCHRAQQARAAEQRGESGS